MTQEALRVWGPWDVASQHSSAPSSESQVDRWGVTGSACVPTGMETHQSQGSLLEGSGYSGQEEEKDSHSLCSPRALACPR